MLLVCKIHDDILQCFLVLRLDFTHGKALNVFINMCYTCVLLIYEVKTTIVFLVGVMGF